MELVNELKLPSTMTDIHGRLGLVGALGLVQDNMCQFFRMLECDGFIMEPLLHCFWVVTKTNIKLFASADWLDEIIVKTYLSKKTNIRLNLTTEIILKKNNTLLAQCVQELCAMGSIDRKIRLVADTLFPKDIEVVDLDYAFKKINVDIETMDNRLLSIEYSNIDFCLHTNNLEYIKFMLNCYPLDFWKDKAVLEFDIQYLSESRFGNELKVYSKKDENKCQFAIVNDGNIITKSELIYG